MLLVIKKKELNLAIILIETLDEILVKSWLVTVKFLSNKLWKCSRGVSLIKKLKPVEIEFMSANNFVDVQSFQNHRKYFKRKVSISEYEVISLLFIIIILKRFKRACAVSEMKDYGIEEAVKYMAQIIANIIHKCAKFTCVTEITMTRCGS